MPHRDEWRHLASIRVAEARVLLDAGHWSGAYYLIGYALECALKAAISTQFRSNTIPEKQLVLDTYQHRLDRLVMVAGLEGARRATAATDAAFDVNWAVAKDWNEGARYSTWAEPDARDLFNAVTHRRHGVLRWIRANW